MAIKKLWERLLLLELLIYLFVITCVLHTKYATCNMELYAHK